MEINPLVLTDKGELVACDAHIDIEDEAFYRQKKLEELYGIKRRESGARKETEFERKAKAIDALDHRGVAGRMIEFEGNLGLIIGGGGASLTTFDAVRKHGGRPANYCEIGGNPGVLKVKELTKHLLSKQGVKKVAVIVNVVSNTRVDLVARGVIKGILESGKVPAGTAMIILIMGSIHIWTILTNLPITAIKSATRIQGGFWLIFYIILLPLVELHVGIGFYRIGVKWGWITRVRRPFFKKFENILTLIFLIIGAVTLYTFYTLAI